ncbi:hypothetical protein Tco_1560776 [Tanacetum coccineum]
MLNPNPDTGIDSILNLNTESISLVDVPVTTNVEMPPSYVTTLPPPPIPHIQPRQQTPVSTPTIVPKFKQTNLFAEAVSSIPDRLRREDQADNEDFINKNDENIRKIIKEKVKVQVKEQLTKILPRIEKSVNEQLEAEVLIRSSIKDKTSYAVAANLSELELKKILIDKMENNKRRDDEDEDEEPSTRSNQGSNRRRAGKEPELTSAPKEKTSKSTGKSKEGSKSHQKYIGNTLAQNEDHRESFNELMDTPLDFSAFVLNRLKVDTLTPELLAGPTFKLMKGSCKSLVELEYFLEEVCKATTNQLDWNNPEGQQYLHDLRKPLSLIPNSRGHRVIPFDHSVNNDLMYLSSRVSSRTYATLVMKTKAADYGHIKWIEDLVPNTIIIRIKKLTIVEWHNYKHLEWVPVHRDDDMLYTFKEGDYNRLCLQDIEDMPLLLVQGKLTNLNIKERLALVVLLRMFTRSIVIRRRIKDLQLVLATDSLEKGRQGKRRSYDLGY